MDNSEAGGAGDRGFTAADAEALGYAHCRVVPGRGIVGVARFLFTHGLIVGITADRYDHRYCYGREDEAIAALEAWDGEGHPPGPWLKRKGLDPEINNPSFKGIPLAVEVPMPRRAGPPEMRQS